MNKLDEKIIAFGLICAFISIIGLLTLIGISIATIGIIPVCTYVCILLIIIGIFACSIGERKGERYEWK